MSICLFFCLVFKAGFVDAFRQYVGTGVLGRYVFFDSLVMMTTFVLDSNFLFLLQRMHDVLQDDNYAVAAIAIDSHGAILDGNSRKNRPVDVIPRYSAKLHLVVVSCSFLRGSLTLSNFCQQLGHISNISFWQSF